MRRRLRARILSLVAVLVLIAAAGWSWRQQQAQLAAQHLLAITPQTITHITLQLSGMVAQRFRKRGGVWWQQVTPPRRADSAQLDALTQIAAAPVLRWLPAHAVRADHLGLTPPLAVLWLNGTRLAFGGLAPLAPERYVQVADGRVALISARYSPYLGTANTQAAAHAGTP
ncbi:conserved hypothetical protein, membrane or secreted [mine drainage metagenome]|uniref:DUF4340 domain-containing protein n=1 Tax=mine drainage metagenome TaxID=410659 RepID=T1BDX4_9ZZZZ